MNLLEHLDALMFIVVLVVILSAFNFEGPQRAIHLREALTFKQARQIGF